MSTKLFVGGISWNTTSEMLKAHFEKTGKVVDIRIITDKQSGRSKGYGFIEMGSDDEAKVAIAELDGSTLDGRTLKVDHAKPMESTLNQEKKDMGDPRGGSNFSNN